MIAILVSFGGVVIMSIGGKQTESHVEQADYKLGIALACATSVGLGVAATLGRKLKSLSTDVVMFNSMGFGSVVMFFVMLFDLQEGKPLSYEQDSTYVFLLIGGMANCIAMYFWTYSTQRAKPSLVALLRQIGVFYGFIVDLVIFKETFNFYQILGAIMVVTTNIVVVYYNWQKELSKQAADQNELLNPLEIEIAAKQTAQHK